MRQIAVFISGGGTNLQALIDASKSGRLQANIACVISNQPQAYGLERGKQAGIPTYVLKDNEDILAVLKEYQVDLIVLAGYLALIPADLIQAYPERIINIHPSLIPAFSGKGYYGLKVHQAAINRGVKVSGATVHCVNENYDEGRILFQETVPVYESDTAEDLASRVLTVEHTILVKAVEYLIEILQGGNHA